MNQYLLIGDLQISVQNSHSLWFATFFSLNTHIYIPSRIWSLSHGFPVSTTTFFGPLIKLILPQALWWPFERKLHIKIYIKYTVFTKSFQTNMAIRPKVCQLSKYTGPLNNLLAAIYPCVSLNTYIKQIITRTYYIFFLFRSLSLVGCWSVAPSWKKLHGHPGSYSSVCGINLQFTSQK